MFHPGILHLQNTLQGILIFNIPSDLCYYNRRLANVKDYLRRQTEAGIDMEVRDSIEKRRSIRKFKDTPVDLELVRGLIDAAVAAPSAKNRQPWKFIVYTGAAKEEICDAMEAGLAREKSGQPILPGWTCGHADADNTLRVMREAPILIAVLNTNGRTPYEDIDTDHRIAEICDSLSIGAAIQNLLLEATAHGLGTLWIANTCFAYPELVKCIGTEYQLISVVSVGYAAEAPDMRPRKKMDEVLEYRGFGCAQGEEGVKTS